MSLDLRGKRAIVTGATKGIGRQIAFSLAEEGVSLGLIARTKVELEALAKELEKYDIQVAMETADIANKQEVEVAVRSLYEMLGSFHILINNAGVAQFGKFLEMPREEWEHVVKVNLFGAYYMTRSVYPYMVEQKRGDIINIASTAGEKGAATTSAQTASKAALIGFTESLAMEAREHNIRVMTVIPSTVVTESTIAKGLVDQNNQERLRAEDVATYIIVALKLHSRSWLKRASLWSTNPGN